MTTKNKGWTALVLAGQRPGLDPLASHFGETWKALVNVGGEPMVTRVLRTLHGVSSVTSLLVLSQSPDALADAVAAGGGAEQRVSGKGISTSILEQVEAAPLFPVLVTTADHPLLTADMVEEFISKAGECDVAVAMVERATMLATYPENKRTWLKFSDGHWSGANLFALRSEKARAALLLWAEAEQDRKKVWKLFLHFGPWLALRALTRTIGLRDALEKAGKRLDINVKLVALSQAEAAIDVDKPSDHVQAEAILAQRANMQ